MIRLGYSHFGTTTSIHPVDGAAAHRVIVTLAGRAAIRWGEQEIVESPQLAAVVSPGRTASIPVLDANAELLTIRFERTRLEEELAGLLGRPVVKPVNFKFAFPLATPAGTRWMALLAGLLRTVETSGADVHPRHLELLERGLVSGLLVSQDHSYSEELTAAPVRQVPRTALDRVTEAIQRAPDREYSLADLARLAGTSARSLQYSFQERYGISPMRYLRQVRLDRVHHDLEQGAGTVTEVACHWGFTNPGRFASAYRERFGESPTATRSREAAVAR
jgi:AraC-like DNA-binding protein